MNRKSFKPHALAAALIVAIAPLGSAIAASDARIHNADAVESGADFSGFIVKFREGTAERADAARVARALQGPDNAMARAARGAAGLRHFRRMSQGADVVRAGRDSNDADPGDWTTGQCGPASNSSWHGTHVAGTVAAVTNNAKGVAGTAFGAKVMHVRALGTCGGSTSDIADAITWASGGAVSGVPTLAASQAAKVINLSLGGSGACGTTTQNAINGAVSRGSTLVIAAGNSNVNVSNATPANCANVIAVASVTQSSSRSSFSNFGTLIDVSAPGSGILSTLNAGTTTPGAETYASYSGTSMATPHVAGVVALMQSRRIAQVRALMTPAEVESTLKSTAYPLAGTCSGGCGAGIVNARAAVDAAGATSGGGTGAQTYTNGTDVAIPDNTTVESAISVSGRTGLASSTTSVAVDIRHTYIGDLLVQLVAPDGSLYTLHNRTGTGTDNIIRSYTVNLSSETLNGTWRLRVNDNARQDTGFINSWSITF